MRIIFAHTPPDLYGASRSLLRLTSRLVKDGNEVQVILNDEGELGRELKKNGIKVIIQKKLFHITRERFKKLSSLIFVFSLPFSVLQITKILRRIEPDIVHTNTALIISPAIAAFLMNKKHIWHMRETFIEYGSLWKIYRILILFLSSKVIAVSKPVAEQFIYKKINNKVVVLNNGFPADEFTPIPTERIMKFKNDFHLNGKLLVGVIGRIKFGRKGQDIFVKASSLIRDKYPNVHFVIIGSPFPGNEEHLTMLKKMIMDLKLEANVTLTGDVKDIKAAISALDISVLPSVLPEPFGGVVIESMAFAKPVIGTNIGGTTEQIVDGESGYLINPNDSPALAEAMERLIINKELRLKMGQKGRELFLSKFEFGKFYTDLMNIYTTTSNIS